MIVEQSLKFVNRSEGCVFMCRQNTQKTEKGVLFLREGSMYCKLSINFAASNIRELFGQIL